MERIKRKINYYRRRSSEIYSLTKYRLPFNLSFFILITILFNNYVIFELYYPQEEKI